MKTEEVKGSLELATPCYLVVHPRGTLMWDVGEIPDVSMPMVGPGSQGRFYRVNGKLLPQLAAIGYTPKDITFLALSHYHSDHTANANEFAASTWIVQERERAAMFAEPPPTRAEPSEYSKLKDSKTTLVRQGDYDVFGDGIVILKYAPGHTEGHQMLFLRLKNSGPVLLAGDLWHYPEERTLDRVPPSDSDPKQTEGVVRRASSI